MATLSKLNILLKIAYPAWPFLIKKIFFSVGQGSGKLSLRASRGAKTVTLRGHVEYARPISRNKKEPMRKLREILAKHGYKATI